MKQRSVAFGWVLFVSLVLCNGSKAQGLGSVTGVQIQGNTLTVSAGTDVVVFKACADNILMINFRPGGIEDPDTLVVAKTDWVQPAVTFDTSGASILLTAAEFRVEIFRNPLRFRFHRLSSKGDQVVCEEPSEGGISQNGLALSTSGGLFYGVHNRSQGVLSNSTGGTISSGNQGQAGGPFVWTTEGWGFLADTDGGSLSIASNSLTFARPASPSKRDLEFYLITGTPKEILKGLHEVTGFPPLFPKYTLGFLNTEWGIDQEELYSDIRTYREKSIPLDAFILDFDWMAWGDDSYGEFRWGQKFPDGQSGAIVDTLQRYGMHLMGIRKPRIHAGTVQGQYAADQGFFIDYTTDYFSQKQVGRLDFHKPEVRKWYWESFLANNSYQRGITGYWNDEADEYGGNLMFMQMQRAQYEGQRAFDSKRVWSINRNFYTGAQRYAYALWSGDIESGFQTMANQRLFMLSSLVMGASWWGMDIGGFKVSPTPENYYRWIQFGAFVPVFRVHGRLDQEREPWYYGAQAESIASKYIRLRYRLMPYIYSAARENHLTGLPIARPLVFEYPDDPAVANLSSEWMFGNSLLVSPVVASGVTQQSVYLPEGIWYDFHSGKEYAGSTQHNVAVTAEEIPLFVKAGSIIPMSPAAQYTDAPEMLKTVELSSYPGGTGSCTVYDDDGVTYGYETGAYSTTGIGHERNNARTTITVNARMGSYAVNQRDWLASVNWALVAPDSVVLDSLRLNPVTLDSVDSFNAVGWFYDAGSKRCLVRFPDDGAGHVLEVFFPEIPSKSESDGHGLPREYELYQNYPNPFNSETAISFQLSALSSVDLRVCDLLGREVVTLIDEVLAPGPHTAVWNAGQFASGMYFYRLRAGSFVDTKKLVVLK